MAMLKRGPRKGDPIEIKDRRFRGPIFGNASRWKPNAHINGDRECQRRAKQIAAGRLRVENGVTQDAWNTIHGAVS